MAPNVPRQSVYFNPNANANQLNNIYACIGRIRFACDTLHETNTALDFHTSDFSRLSTVLKNQRHFDLVSERDVKQAREHVAAEIAPLLRELIVRAEDVLAKNERHVRTLRNKATEELAKVEAHSQSQSIGGVRDEPGSPTVATLVAQAELEDKQRELEELRRERMSLMERVQAMEKDGN